MDDGFLTGQSLQEVLVQQGPLQPAVLLELMKPAAEELARLHQMGRIAGNISLETVTVSNYWWFCFSLPEENRKKGDGLCRSRLPEPAEFPFGTDGAGARHGIPLEAYVDRGQIGPWSDVYSLCAVIYTMLTGHSVSAIGEWIAGAELKSPAAFGVRNLSPDLEETLRQGLRIRWKERIPNGAELYRLLYEKKTAARTVRKHSVQPSGKSPSAGKGKTGGQKKKKEKTEQYRYFGIKRAKKTFRGGLPQVIQIPEKTDVILADAFQSVIYPEKWAKVKQIILPESVRAIESHGLWQLEAEESITVPDQVMEIGADAFRLGPSGYIVCSRGTRAYAYCQENHLRTSVDREEWRRQGRCQYCGGKLSFLQHTCKECGRQKDY